MIATVYVVACECHQPIGLNVFCSRAEMITAAPHYQQHGEPSIDEIADELMACAEAIEVPSGLDIGNGYFDSRVEFDAAVRAADRA